MTLHVEMCRSCTKLGHYLAPQEAIERVFLTHFVKAVYANTRTPTSAPYGLTRPLLEPKTPFEQAHALVERYNRVYNKPDWHAGNGRQATVADFQTAYTSALASTAADFPTCSIESQVFIILAGGAWRSSPGMFA